MLKVKIDKAISDCKAQIRHLNLAYNNMNKFFPLNENTYQNLTDSQIKDLDQFLFRFSKLQDIISVQVFKLIFELIGEINLRNVPFIDKLNRLEQLQVIDNKNSWIQLRNLRNEFTHGYEDEPEQAVIILNQAFIKKDYIETIFKNCLSFIEKYSK